MLKNNYRDFRKSISRLVIAADPIGLIAGGAPADEYEQEISKIIVAIKGDRNKKSIAEKMQKIFIEAFDEQTSMPVHKYEDLAEQILSLQS